MMKKLLSLLLVCFLSVGTIEAIVTPDDPPSSSIIDLFGDLVNNPGPNSVEAYYSNNMVVVCFHQNFGYVHMILIGEMGNTVYNNTVNTAIHCKS